jgi:uncharacterized cupin superfamily protein
MNTRAALKPPALDPASVPTVYGSNYPAPFKAGVAKRAKRRLGDALGLTNFGVNMTTLPLGCGSALRHWHTREDEFIYVLEGELVLLTGGAEQLLIAGMAAGFAAGKADGHCLVNRSDRDAVYLEVGDRRPDDAVHYPDVDLEVRTIDGTRTYLHKDGTAY